MIGMVAGDLSRHRENGALTLNNVNNMSVHASLTLQARGQFIPTSNATPPCTSTGPRFILDSA